LLGENPLSALFIDLLDVEDKAETLRTALDNVNRLDGRIFQIDPNRFRELPRSPFAYWAGDEAYHVFEKYPLFGHDNEAWAGLQTNDDFRWLRLWTEVRGEEIQGDRSYEFDTAWVPYAKGGEHSPYYSDLPLVVEWGRNGRQIKEWKLSELRLGRITANNSKCWNEEKYFNWGVTWSQRSQIGMSVRALPRGCIFGIKGPSAFCSGGREATLAFLAISNSNPFMSLVAMQMCFGSYDTGMIRNTPVPKINLKEASYLSELSVKAWKIRRDHDICNEVSHAFILPHLLMARLIPDFGGVWNDKLLSIRSDIDERVAKSYGIGSVHDIKMAEQVSKGDLRDEGDDSDGELETLEIPSDAALSWAAGVAHGRFDWRLATGERAIPPDPDPFDPLPNKSVGMLRDGAEPFHAHGGVLVDDQGHPHDLVHLIEEVLTRVNTAVPDDVRHWVQRDFFALHLRRYSKSRRRAPIYWPLSTASGSYTLWIYYPSLTSQTLYTAINDFAEPKLKQVGDDVTALRNKGGARTRDNETQFETLQALEQELIELRDTLLELAPTYKPNHDDGVQITAAPLWPLFRHKPWQKVLKETWAKLEKGDYDWAHLAMNYWPQRVREECKIDKSLAIAHGLENLYIEPGPKPEKTRAKKIQGDVQ
jgi:hypothetical protein